MEESTFPCRDKLASPHLFREEAPPRSFCILLHKTCKGTFGPQSDYQLRRRFRARDQFSRGTPKSNLHSSMALLELARARSARQRAQNFESGHLDMYHSGIFRLPFLLVVSFLASPKVRDCFVAMVLTIKKAAHIRIRSKNRGEAPGTSANGRGHYR